MVEFVFKTEKGKRENNEDYYGNYKNELFVVADGLGGHVAGEVASKLGVEVVLAAFKNLQKSGAEVDFDLVFKKANDAILEGVQKNPDRAGMATTMLAAQIVNNNSMVFANVGDCRAYLLSGNKLEQVTSDDRDEVGFLLRALGAHNEDIQPRIIKKGIKPGEIALLCSDGLHDFVSDRVIEKILGSEASLESKAAGLIEAALQFGSTDNITVALIKI